MHTVFPWNARWIKHHQLVFSPNAIPPLHQKPWCTLSSNFTQEVQCAGLTMGIPILAELMLFQV